MVRCYLSVASLKFLYNKRLYCLPVLSPGQAPPKVVLQGEATMLLVH